LPVFTLSAGRASFFIGNCLRAADFSTLIGLWMTLSNSDKKKDLTTEDTEKNSLGAEVRTAIG